MLLNTSQPVVFCDGPFRDRRDPGSKIRVHTTEQGGRVNLHYEVLDTSGLVPAIHFIETLGYAKLMNLGDISVSLVDRVSETPDEDYRDRMYNVRDPKKRGPIPDGQYNFILLNDAKPHYMSEIIEGFVKFKQGGFSSLFARPFSPRFLMIKDFPDGGSEDLVMNSWELAWRCFSPQGNVGYSSYDINGFPGAVYISLTDLEGFAKEMLGKGGDYSNTDLSAIGRDTRVISL